MTRRSAPLQINQFTGGLNTDASPLNFPIDSSKDELNLNLNRDGSRQKRVGFDYETGATIYSTGVLPNTNQTLGRSTFKWDNAGGNSEKSLIVTQIANSIHIFDLDNTPLTSTRLYTKTYTDVEYGSVFSFAVVDGLLVVATGLKSIYVYEYDPDTESISENEETLYIRDLFGVQATDGSTELTLPQNFSLRPSTLTDEHLYNLRNQGFNKSWYVNNTETAGDPISAFYTSSGSTVYPSNADNINLNIYADANDGDNRLVERFFSDNLFAEKPGNSTSSNGAFIIDALERGTSRLAQEVIMRNRDADLSLAVVSLPTDKTPGGATVVGEFSGHIFFAGFSGVVEGGDSKSPRMSSYLLFSPRVRDVSDIGRCYQQADPTDRDDNVLVDTDGGFIRIEGAFGINKLVSLRGSLFVFADNGVWRVTGTDNTAFSATNYQVSRVTERGCISANSVVTANDEIFYWGEDNIYVIQFNEFNQAVASPITENKIQFEYLNNISSVQKENASGVYDDFQRQVRWVYSELETATSSKELIYDLRFGAFTKNSVATTGSMIPVLYDIVNTTPFDVSSVTATVTVGGTTVTVGGEDVTTNENVRSSQLKETIYLVITNMSSDIEFTFGSYFDTRLYDWVQSTQTDYDSYLTTGDLTLGEPRSLKQMTNLYTFFKRTETGIVNGEPINPSSCLISSRMDWSNSSASGKWSTPRQAYRPPRVYTPEFSDDYDLGFSLIKTKNILRGFGKSSSIKLEGEAGKDMHIHGWAFDMDASGVK